jgi:hypothetical protein
MHDPENNHGFKPNMFEANLMLELVKFSDLTDYLHHK